MVLSTPAAFADVTNNDGTINFTGEITDAACTVDIGTDNTLTVDLGTVNKSVFTGVGSYASATEFDLKVKDCPETVTSISAKFDGNGFNGDNSVLAITEAADAAKGVAIELLDQNKAAFSLFADTDLYDLPAGQTTLTMPFYARYKQMEDTVVAGKANSTAQFTLNYN